MGGRRTWSAAALVMMAAALFVSPASVGASVVTSGGVSYVTTKQTVKPHGFKRSAAICPKHTSVLGGGEVASTHFGTIDLRQTSPVDTGDSNRTPDDGWGVLVYNQSHKQSRITVTASCGHTRVTYATDRISVKSRHSRVHDVRCPSGLWPFSGGVSAKSSHLRLDWTTLHGIHTSHVWSSEVSAPAPLTATLYAACLKPEPLVSIAAGAALPNREKEHQLSCSNSQRAYGVGVTSTGTGKAQTINSLSVFAPTASLPGGGAQAAMDFGPVTDGGMETKALCGPKLKR